MIAYKLFKLRKNGTLGSLFINSRAIIPMNILLCAEEHQTKGFAFRPGWHCTHLPCAPHLGTKGRVWCEVEINKYVEFKRPEHQGGMWYLAEDITVTKILTQQEIDACLTCHKIR